MDRYDLSKKQSDWLESLKSQPDYMKFVHAFMAKGPAGVAQRMDINTHETFFMAQVRGIYVSDEQFKKYGDAEAAAEARLAELHAMTDLPVLDEVALGIDDSNYRISCDSWDYSLHTTQIFHLGAQAGSDGPSGIPDELADLLHDFGAKKPPAAAKDMPGFAKMLKECIKDFGRRDGLAEAINEYLQRNGTYGFLVKFQVPVKDYNEKGDSASYSWGHCWQETFYGETFQEAYEKAKLWADTMQEKDKERGRKKAEEKREKENPIVAHTFTPGETLCNACANCDGGDHCTPMRQADAQGVTCAKCGTAVALLGEFQGGSNA